jgi:hypothetical protein
MSEERYLDYEIKIWMRADPRAEYVNIRVNYQGVEFYSVNIIPHAAKFSPDLDNVAASVGKSVEALVKGFFDLRKKEAEKE